MKLSQLISSLDYQCVQGSTDIDIETVVYDSRKVTANSVFICVKGAISDGHKFAQMACEMGAAALVAEDDIDVPENVTVIKVKNSRYALACISAEYFNHPAKKLKVIGITGTKGKTTTTYLVKSILENAGHKCGLVGTIETIIGDKVIKANNTTPESYILQDYFSQMVEAGCDCVVMEVSSQGLMLHRTAGFIFDVGIFTNIEPDHIGPNEHKDFEDYLRCKSLLFKQCKYGIINADADYADYIISNATCETMTYGFAENANFRANNVTLLNKPGHLGVSYNITGDISMNVDIDLPGKFSVYNSLTAIAICKHFGIENSVITQALNDVRVKGRIELVKVSDDFTLMIDYAHNAMALESLLTTLRAYNPQRLVCLFGCGGDRARDRRFSMGEVSGNLADLTIITSDNPRTENPQAIIDDIITGIKRTNGKYVEIIDRRKAIEWAIHNAEAGDIIVLAGKGHEDYQEINGVKNHLDEREVIAEVLAGIKQ
ncbi:MAG: UDP-N-acetylmuramoyl-L-alanyl-D-glutamate--2,6-diaminopimelate ligase [Acutalibacteraceae bacterium]|nr:UDP-N-acetylmuramoyl-L-alanyl-D-glutamate--2,6-diaminopimelate ligase [Acutalibacteraceae bacterium]